MTGHSKLRALITSAPRPWKKRRKTVISLVNMLKNDGKMGIEPSKKVLSGIYS
jgi:hypothetical protein